MRALRPGHSYALKVICAIGQLSILLYKNSVIAHSLPDTGVSKMRNCNSLSFKITFNVMVKDMASDCQDITWFISDEEIQGLNPNSPTFEITKASQNGPSQGRVL